MAGKNDNLRMDKKYIVALQGKDFVLYSGMLAMAHEQGFIGFETMLLQAPTKENGETAIVLATAHFPPSTDYPEGRHSTGIGDANPKNVNSKIALHAIRMAETRAKARAFRDALNIAETAFEELGGAEDDERDVSRQQKASYEPAPSATKAFSRATPPTKAAPVAKDPAPATDAAPPQFITPAQRKSILNGWKLLGHDVQTLADDVPYAEAEALLTDLRAEYDQLGAQREAAAAKTTRK